MNKINAIVAEMDMINLVNKEKINALNECIEVMYNKISFIREKYTMAIKMNISENNRIKLINERNEIIIELEKFVVILQQDKKKLMM